MSYSPSPKLECMQIYGNPLCLAKYNETKITWQVTYDARLEKDNKQLHSSPSRLVFPHSPYSCSPQLPVLLIDTDYSSPHAG